MRRFYLNLYLFFAAVYLLSASGRIGLADSVAMLNVTHSMAHEFSLNSEPCTPNLLAHPNHCVLGVDGRYYAGFGLLPSVLAVPALLTGEWVAGLFHANPSAVARVSVSLFTALLSAVAPVVLAMWILKLGYSSRTALCAAVILALASPFWHFGVKGFYSEPFVTLGLLLTAYLLSASRSSLAVAFAGLAFGAACACRINVVILYPVFLLFLMFQTIVRKWRLLQFVREAMMFTAAFSIFAVLIALSNYSRFASITKTGYHLVYPSTSLLFATPFFHGVFGLLLNGEVGLLVFAPWVIISLLCFPSFLRAHLPEAMSCGTLFLFTLVFFAKYDSWHGGWVAGPRFLTPALPFLILAIVPLLERLLTGSGSSLNPHPVLRPMLISLVLLGFLVQAFGVFFPEERYYALTTTFYERLSAKPWWRGSIPLASVDFLPQMRTTTPEMIRTSLSSDPARLAAEADTEKWAAVRSTTTESQFLSALPNSENFLMPNLLLFKLRLLGIPSIAASIYGLSLSCLAAVGLTGIKRYAFGRTPNLNIIG
jgi:hypothetical protein